jgi:hypothetical protein
MVVTASLARGAVRAAVEKHCETQSDLHTRIRRTGMKPPSTMRRFDEWLRKHTAVHERDALLIASGMIRRRSAAFAAYHPNFKTQDIGWNLSVFTYRFVISPGRIDEYDQGMLPLEISGHALERIFQRTNEIAWAVVRDYLASAVTFANAVLPGFSLANCKQCAIPADRGMFVGQMDGGALKLKTFLPDSQLGLRWQALYNGLNDFAAQHRDAINGATITPDQELARSFKEFLCCGRYSWIFRPYVPGEDPLEDAWRSRES